MKKLLGGILLATGILIAWASGLCSLVFVANIFFSGNSVLEPLVIALLFGGPPFLIGVGLFFAGRALIRSARKTAETEHE